MIDQRIAVAVDVGGTGTRLRIDDSMTVPSFEAELPGAQVTSAGLDLRSLLASIAAALAQFDEQQRDRRTDGQLPGVALAIGSTSLPDLVADDPRDMLAELRAVGVRRVVLAADSVTAHIGALRFEPGVVVAAGTGVVALGTDLDSVWHRVDGWGHLLGDDGSGVWIGMHGLRAALRALDGRIDGSAMLEAMAVERFGSPERIVSDVYTRADRAGLMATFAPDVFTAAHTGDSVAMAIVERAGIHLADTAAAAVERSGQRTVAHAGRLFEAGDILLGPMRTRLRQLTGLELTEPLGTPLDGAMALARLAADQPARVPHSPQHLITMIGDAA